MTISQILENKTLNVRRTLYDKSIKLNGEETFALRISFEEDKYGDYVDDVRIVRSNIIPVVLNLSETEIPLSKYRTFDNNFTQSAGSTVPLIFDLLSIDMYSQFYPENPIDRLSREDLIVYRNFDEYGKPLFLVLQIKEVLGVYNHSHLRWKKYECALATTSIQEEQEIKTLLATLPENWENLSNQ